MSHFTTQQAIKLSLAALCSAFITAASATAYDAEFTAKSSMDVQIKAVSVAIDKIAAAGLAQQFIAASSMDVQIKAVSVAIDKIAAAGLAR
jgi:hypothetical protein